MNAKRLTVVVNDLKRVLLRSKRIDRQISSGLSSDQAAPDKVKFKIGFKVFELLLSLHKKSHKYLNLSIQNIRFRHQFILFPKLKFSMEKCVIFNKYEDSDEYPNFIESDVLSIKYNTLRNRYLKMNSKGIQIFLDLKTLVHVAQSGSALLNQDLDTARYLDQISESTERCKSQGQILLWSH